ncbi:MAG TPA: carbohydrate ABC transporter permease [Baekduia sp.]|nr:carbohydrate ABC transporter permease [Baekduia sp.]
MRERGKWGAIDAVVIAFAVIPVLWILSLSLKDRSTVSDGRVIPQKWTFDNYSEIFHQDEFKAAFVNSIVIALATTLIAVVLGAMAAYAIARLDFPGKNLMLGVSLCIAMFPLVSLVGPIFDIWRQVGLFDTRQGLVIPYLAFSLPLAIYTLAAFFREIPWELEQAAQVDGATPLQAFRRVIVPLAAPGTFTAAILVFIFSWQEFLLSISLTSTDNARTVPAALAFFTGESQFTQPTGSIAAAAVVVTIPIIVMVLIFQRRIVSGLTAGAVKG